MSPYLRVRSGKKYLRVRLLVEKLSYRLIGPVSVIVSSSKQHNNTTRLTNLADVQN